MSPLKCGVEALLAAASQSPYVITGMSTIWWGNNNNPHPVGVQQVPDPDPASNNAQGLFADPCPVCSVNETYIMMHVGQARRARRGARFAMEAPF